MKRNIEIRAYRCTRCGKLHYPYHDRCLACQGRQFETVSPQGQARLLAYTQIFNLPWGFDQRYLFMGVGEFENGVRALGQIRLPAGAGQLRTGMSLTPTWDVVRVVNGEDVYGLVYLAG